MYHPFQPGMCSSASDFEGMYQYGAYWGPPSQEPSTYDDRGMFLQGQQPQFGYYDPPPTQEPSEAVFGDVHFQNNHYFDNFYDWRQEHHPEFAYQEEAYWGPPPQETPIDELKDLLLQQHEIAAELRHIQAIQRETSENSVAADTHLQNPDNSYDWRWEHNPEFAYNDETYWSLLLQVKSNMRDLREQIEAHLQNPGHHIARLTPSSSPNVDICEAMVEETPEEEDDRFAKFVAMVEEIQRTEASRITELGCCVDSVEMMDGKNDGEQREEKGREIPSRDISDKEAVKEVERPMEEKENEEPQDFNSIRLEIEPIEFVLLEVPKKFPGVEPIQPMHRSACAEPKHITSFMIDFGATKDMTKASKLNLEHKEYG